MPAARGVRLARAAAGRAVPHLQGKCGGGAVGRARRRGRDGGGGDHGRIAQARAVAQELEAAAHAPRAAGTAPALRLRARRRLQRDRERVRDAQPREGRVQLEVLRRDAAVQLVVAQPELIAGASAVLAAPLEPIAQRARLRRELVVLARRRRVRVGPRVAHRVERGREVQTRRRRRNCPLSFREHRLVVVRILVVGSIATLDVGR